MKADERFHCFGCQADGDVISFTSRLFDLSPKDAALKLASDFGIAYDEHLPLYIVRKHPEISKEERFQHQASYCFSELAAYRISWCNGRSSMLRNLQTTTFIPDFWKRYIIWMM